MGSRSPHVPSRLGRGRGGRDERGGSSRPGERRRTSANGSASAGPVGGAESEVVEDDLAHDVEVDRPIPAPAAEDAGSTPRVRSSRGARTARTRPGVAQAALHRVRGVNPRHAVIMAVVLAFVTLTLAMPLRTFFAQQAEFDQLRESNAALRAEVADYQQKVNEQGDPAYTEAKARARLQYARPGETVLVLTFPGQEERQAEQERAAAKARNPWYGNLWDSVATPVTTR